MVFKQPLRRHQGKNNRWTVKKPSELKIDKRGLSPSYTQISAIYLNKLQIF